MFTFPLTKQQINDLAEDEIHKLVEIDKHGILYGSNESFEHFKNRLFTLLSEIENIKKQLDSSENLSICNKILLTTSNMINETNFSVVNQITERYSFSIDWAPGFFANKTIGFFTGGFTVITDADFPIFILRSNFKGKSKWLIYSLTELLSHELCHVARAPIADSKFEEFFAYGLSPSRFRRHFGSLFHSPIDSVLVLLPIFLLLIITIINTFFFIGLDEIYFWIVAFIYPIFLFIRNFYYHNIYKKAYKALNMMVNSKRFTESILFRCNAHEIKKISSYYKLDKSDLLRHLKEYAHKSIRWKIILKRFIIP